MTTAQPAQPAALLAFADQQGNYYLLPREVVARCRVSAEDKAAVEAVVEESEDVAGFAEVFQAAQLNLVGVLPEPLPGPLARYSIMPTPLSQPVSVTPIQLP